MRGHEIETPSGEALLRLVHALGRHRYVAGRRHLIHAFVFEAVESHHEARSEGGRWAHATLNDPAIEHDSKDERLYRSSSDAELVEVLRVFWTPGELRARACATLARRLAEIGVETPHAIFDEAAEEAMFPVLVDAGWELLALSELDSERHRGAIDAFDDAFSFDVAKFEEENTVPKVVTLCELPALGAAELLHLLDEASCPREPFVIWFEGHDTYVDYVLRGILRAAKLEITTAA